MRTGLVLVYGNPQAAGSGIPRTKAQYFRNFGVIPLREAVYRFFVGTISVGFSLIVLFEILVGIVIILNAIANHGWGLIFLS